MSNLKHSKGCIAVSATAGLVAAGTWSPAKAQPSETAPSMTPQPVPSSFAGDESTADILVETLIA
jgi:hypothetical protein